jgi:AraC-like DNA-binding protein
MLSLEKLLDGLDIDVEPFALCEVRGSGRLDMGCRDEATLHYALAGTGRLKIANGETISVVPGTVLIVPPRLSHRLEAAKTTAAPVVPLPHCAPLGEDWQQLQAGTGAAGILVACSTLRVTYQQAQGLFDYLAEPIIACLERDHPIRHSLDLLLAELAAPKPGTRALVRALMQQCLVLLLRRHCASGECRVPWLSALEDPRLGRAVAAIFEYPEALHTLERLAALAGMSRSAFAEHFAAEFGRGPMDLLKEVRLRRAAQLLRSTDTPIKALPGRVGYRSRSYFSRAFKDLFDISPAEYRTAWRSVDAESAGGRGLSA